MKRMLLPAGILLAAAAGTGVISRKYYLQFVKRPSHHILDLDPERHGVLPVEYIEQAKQAKDALAGREEIMHVIAEDGAVMEGLLYRTAENNKKVVIAFHGYQGGCYWDMARFAPMYEKLNCDYLLIQERAHENSEGQRVTFGVKEKRDGIVWCREIIRRYGEDVQILLHGVSMGAATILCMSGEADLPVQVKGIAADCGYCNMYEETDNVLKKIPELPRKIMLELISIWSVVYTGSSLEALSPENAVKHARIPALLIHGEEDALVPHYMQARIANAYAGEKTVMSVPGAAHVMSWLKDPVQYEQKFTELAEKCFD